MPPTPLILLEIDDNTPAEMPPFAFDVSVWSFADDLNLGTRAAVETFRSLHAACGGAVFRGYPVRAAEATLKLLGDFCDPGEVTWLSGAEVMAGRACFPTGGDGVSRSLRLLLDTVETAGRHFGADRVRLVFAFV